MTPMITAELLVLRKRAATIRHVEATHDWVLGLARGLRRRGG